MSSSAGLLIICFNRPDLLSRVLEKVPSDFKGPIYVSRDGQRLSHPEDHHAVREVESIVLEHFAETPDFHTTFHEGNLGCRVHVQTALNWFFSMVAEGVILEDDCVPGEDFFPFCLEMLERWRDNPKVMHVSGDNSVGAVAPRDSSYGFSERPLVWGWATWRRAWMQSDTELSSWRDVRGTKFEKLLWPTKKEMLRRRMLLDSISRDGVPDTWDAQWAYSVRLMGGIAVMPAKNLISNIGFREDATHTKRRGHIRENFPQGKVFPLRHPKDIRPTMEAFS